LPRSFNGFFIVCALAIVCFALLSLGCGNYNYTGFGTNGTVTGGTGSGASGLSERVFAANLNPSVGTSAIQVVDAAKDLPALNSSTLQPFRVALGGSLPTLMIPGANNTTITFNSGDNGISVVDNSTEALIKTLGSTDCSPTPTPCEFPLPGSTESIAESSDGKFIYTAIPSTSQVTTIPITASTIKAASIPATPLNCQSTNNCLPGAHRIVLSHNNNKLLVFNEQLPSQLEIINTADSTVQTVSLPGQLDHPIYGVFSSDDSKAYILNCGAECGGTQASIAVLDMTALTVSQSVPVDAATIAISDSSNLYVAGSNPRTATPGSGSLTILSLSSLTVGKQITISDGFHQVIALFQNKVIVGARNCTAGCMSLVDPGAGTAIVDAAKGPVTAITGITPRTVFYTAEGGEVRVYDVATGNEHLSNNTPVIDVVGQVTSVLYVGPKTQ